MDNLNKYWDCIERQDLSKELQEFVDSIPIESMIALIQFAQKKLVDSQNKTKISIYIPSQEYLEQTPDHPLIEVIGKEQAMNLASAHSGQYLRFIGATRSLQRARKRQILKRNSTLKAQGHRYTERQRLLSREFKITEIAIFKILQADRKAQPDKELAYA